MKRLTFVEIDLDYCALRYAEGACTAPAGEAKCFNTKATCKARTAFVNEPITMRFAVGTDYLVESGIDYVAACIESVNFMPATVSLGENLGTRASLSVEMSDFTFGDTGKGFDKYQSERSYDPYKVGTFWGKFRARHPYLRGRAIRLIRGELGQTLAQMETRHFIMESFDAPTIDGRYTIQAKDALKMADGDRAKCPPASRGFLVNDITATDVTVTMGPAGQGNIDYPTSGLINIAGKEIVGFTRSGNTLTLQRGLEGTLPQAHKAQDRLQLCVKYNGMDPADIIRDLFVTYAKMPAEYIRLQNWKDETSLFLRRLYTRVIAEPSDVDKLVSELVKQAALSIWWDDVSRTVQLRVLRKIETEAAIFDDNNILQGSLDVREQPDRRLSQSITYFGQRTPLDRASEATSYHSMQLDVNLEAEDDYGGPAIDTVFSSWIPQFGRPIAKRLNDIQLGRFLNPPRRFTFDVFKDNNVMAPVLGQGYRLFARPMQTATGVQENVPIQITRLLPSDSGYRITADEMRFIEFSEEDLDNRTIIIDSNTLNFNWRASYDQLYPPPTPQDDIICIVSGGVIVGSREVSIPSFTVGNWPTGVKLDLRIQGRIQGKGGNGGNLYAGEGGGLQIGRAENGGTSIYTRTPVRITQSNQIWGGGGGGATRVTGGGSNYYFYGGGGGQGYVGGAGGFVNDQPNPRPGGSGSSEARGLGDGDGYSGGAAGNRGDGPTTGAFPSGLAGNAIDGNSYITFTAGTGDIRGPRIN